MNIQEYGVEELGGILGFLLSLAFVRTVRFVNKYAQTKVLVLGVPPWRKLTSSDLFNKRCVEIQ